MAIALEATNVSYEMLADIEREFDDVETEILRQQVHLSHALYEKRSKILSQIPNFWPLVLEQAPLDIDHFIQPSDSALLLSSLTSLSVSRFEISCPPLSTNPNPSMNGSTKGNIRSKGDPRSIEITLEFSPNAYFENSRLVKRFWYRKSRDGFQGLVSEPVRIQWREGKDLTGGMLGLVCDVWEERTRGNLIHGDSNSNGNGSNNSLKKTKALTTKQKSLQRKIENTGVGGLSFFAWFGYIGREVSREENEAAVLLENALREERRNGAISVAELDSKTEEDEDEEIDLEIFPDGDDLALAIADDLWPGAIKYFTQAQEQDALSDADFETDDEDLLEYNEDDNAREDIDDGDAENRSTKAQENNEPKRKKIRV
ncbi:hypothetical protein B7494_g7959 [Chlorociboria aeruginascens]|nr:hypothetical protein B7494_g7959 [Chlorociboria aeruginascens]